MKDKLKKLFKDNKKRSIMMLITIWLVIFLMSGTYAWFSLRTSGDMPVMMGSACMLTATNTFTNTRVMPGDTIEGEISFRSISTRDSFVRVRINVVNPESFFVGEDTFYDIFDKEKNPTLRKHGDWYYVPGEFKPGDQLTVLENITIRGRKVGPEYQNKNLQIKVEIDCIQATEGAVTELWIDSGDLTEREAGRLAYIPLIAGPCDIATASDLARVSNGTNANGFPGCTTLTLINDMDLAAYEVCSEVYGEEDDCTNPFAVWTPIQNPAFNIDGDGHTIRNLRSFTGGLFNNLWHARTISNLHLENCQLTHQATGCIANMWVGTATNVSATGSIVTNQGQVGGLFGQVSSISNASSEVNVTGGNCVGGIAGQLNPSSNSVMTNIRSTGNVSGSGITGGIFGCVGSSANRVISNVYATGNVSSTGQGVGGLIGQIQMQHVGGSPITSIRLINSYYAGNNLSIGTGTRFGPVFGQIWEQMDEDNGLYHETIVHDRNCIIPGWNQMCINPNASDWETVFWLNTTTFNPTTGRNNFGTSRTASQLTSLNDLSGINNNPSWRITPGVNNGRPCLIGVTPGC